MLHVPQLLKLKNGLVPVVKPRFLVGLLKRNLNQTPLFLLTYPAFPVGLAHLVLYFPFALHRLLKTYKIRVPLSPYSILYYHPQRLAYILIRFQVFQNVKICILIFLYFFFFSPFFAYKQRPIIIQKHFFRNLKPRFYKFFCCISIP